MVTVILQVKGFTLYVLLPHVSNCCSKCLSEIRPQLTLYNPRLHIRKNL